LHQTKYSGGQAEQMVNKRRLVRVKTDKTREFNATLTIDNIKHHCLVEDFHFQSVRLFCPQFSEVKSFSNLGPLKIHYGKTIIGKRETPRLIRITDDFRIVLDLSEVPGERGIRKKERLHTKPHFRATILAVDPIKFGSTLHFDVLNFTSTGMLLSSSLSNRHLLKGCKVENAKILLPGLDIVSASFRVEHIGIKDNRMCLGVSFENLTQLASEALAQFGLYGTEPPTGEDMGKKFTSIKESVAPIRNLGNSVRIEVISTPEDYHQVLRIRHEAYLAAKKLDETIRLEDMADEYDLHSIILIAKTDNAVVGTLRIVECRSKDQTFPLEKYFDFNVIDKPENRNRYYEISRLAVDPKFQGTDVVLKIFKELTRILGANLNMTAVCVATRSVRSLYTRIGFYVISKETHHPVAKDDHLAILKVDSKDFLLGKGISAHAWDVVAKDAFDNLSSAELTDLKPNRTMINFRLKIEKLWLLAKRHKSKYSKRNA
jgi:ribosomal protein S18 acetylase RimI-like enzyme